MVSVKVATPQNPFKMPEFNPETEYDSQFYNQFIENQKLLAQLDKEADEKHEIEMRILRIQDFYDKNLKDIIAKRYKNGRKIHERKTNDELEKNQVCPYEGCGKAYASEGSLNLHIKNKHNGGNKTDREKLAKALVIR